MMQLITLTLIDSTKFRKKCTDQFSLQRTKDCGLPTILWLGAVRVYVQDIITRECLLDVLQTSTIQNIDREP